MSTDRVSGVRRKLVTAAGLMSLSFSGVAAIQSGSGYVTFVVPYPPGGGSDALARVLAPKLAEVLGKPVLINNITGASGSIAANWVLSRPDPQNVLFMGSATETVLAPLVLKAVRYKPTNFRMLGLVDDAPLVMLTRPDFPTKNIDELIAYARRPGMAPLTYGTTGPGSVYHVAMESFRRELQIPMTHVPYRGGAPMLQDLMAGVIDVTFLPVGALVAGYVNSGSIKAMAVASANRARQLSGIPLFRESRLAQNFKPSTVWTAVMTAATAPESAVNALHRALAEILQKSDVRAAIEASVAGVSRPMMSLPEAQAFFQSQAEALAEQVRAADVQPG